MNCDSSDFFGKEQRGSTGACQRCGIENVNKQNGIKSLYLMCLVDGEVTEWGSTTLFLLSHYQGMMAFDDKTASMPENRDRCNKSNNCVDACFVQSQLHPNFL